LISAAPRIEFGARRCVFLEKAGILRVCIPHPVSFVQKMRKNPAKVLDLGQAV